MPDFTGLYQAIQNGGPAVILLLLIAVVLLASGMVSTPWTKPAKDLDLVRQQRDQAVAIATTMQAHQERQLSIAERLSDVAERSLDDLEAIMGRWRRAEGGEPPLAEPPRLPRPRRRRA